MVYLYDTCHWKQQLDLEDRAQKRNLLRSMQFSYSNARLIEHFAHLTSTSRTMYHDRCGSRSAWLTETTIGTLQLHAIDRCGRQWTAEFNLDLYFAGDRSRFELARSSLQSHRSAELKAIPQTHSSTSKSTIFSIGSSDCESPTSPILNSLTDPSVHVSAYDTLVSDILHAIIEKLCREIGCSLADAPTTRRNVSPVALPELGILSRLEHCDEKHLVEDAVTRRLEKLGWSLSFPDSFSMVATWTRDRSLESPLRIFFQD